LPGLLPTAWLLHGTDDTIEFMAAGLFSLAAIGLATLLGTRRRMLVPVAVVVLALSLINSWIAHALFRA
jgi:hypothetical protein